MHTCKNKGWSAITRTNMQSFSWAWPRTTRGRDCSQKRYRKNFTPCNHFAWAWPCTARGRDCSQKRYRKNFTPCNHFAWVALLLFLVVWAGIPTWVASDCECTVTVLVTAWRTWPWDKQILAAMCFNESRRFQHVIAIEQNVNPMLLLHILWQHMGQLHCRCHCLKDRCWVR